ncbi:MAG: hypothetical protein HYW23_02500 [Candidatus Aenigmarchaeota archaeon]|nr:hypothetical protein [Candidatus Aenigmarchaeota archaeon]
MKLVSINYSGILVSVVSITTFVILLTVSLEYASISHSLCGSPLCTITNHIPMQSYAGFALLIVSAVVGGYLAFRPQKIEKSVQAIPKSKLNKLIENLQDDEKKVFDGIVKNDGSVFQNDLIGSTGYSKVKVSRLLDRLETKGLVERRRRGMANLILLKYGE